VETPPAWLQAVARARPLSTTRPLQAQEGEEGAKKRSEELASHLYVLSKAAHSGPSAFVSEREPPAYLLHLGAERTMWRAA
jgi:hypothetical protein